MRQDLLTGGGETHPPADFLKQRNGKLLLQLLDMKSHGMFLQRKTTAIFSV